MKVDYIVVGAGLAGVLFCDFLRKKNKSFIVLDDSSQQSSIVAGGLYNPVVLKRFTPVWKAKEQLDIALPVYSEIQSYCNVDIDHKIPVLRLFNSVEEQNNWFTASDKIGLSEFLSTNIIQINNDFVESPFGFGKVLQTGRINTALLIASFKNQLKESNQLIEESFLYEELLIKESQVRYKSIESDNIVFAEGYGIKRNPFFRDLPLKGTKGELLVIHAPDLRLDFVLKSSVFLIPLGDHKYIVGATYNWDDKSNSPTEKGKEELIAKLDKLISCSYDVVEHRAGMRPTVIDRRPLVGRHKDYKNVYVLNGLGTRGVMIAPYVANQLFNYIEIDKELDSEININRFN